MSPPPPPTLKLRPRASHLAAGPDGGPLKEALKSSLKPYMGDIFGNHPADGAILYLSRFETNKSNKKKNQGGERRLSLSLPWGCMIGGRGAQDRPTGRATWREPWVRRPAALLLIVQAKAAGACSRCCRPCSAVTGTRTRTARSTTPRTSR